MRFQPGFTAMITSNRSASVPGARSASVSGGVFSSVEQRFGLADILGVASLGQFVENRLQCGTRRAHSRPVAVALALAEQAGRGSQLECPCAMAASRLQRPLELGLDFVL